ncbi:MAG: phosphatidate phosphatase PAH1 [Celeribacter sp.]|jgi:phosphatidate phosphatase PAH1
MTTAHRNAVIFDVDGTLTPSVLSILRPRHGAAEAVRAFCDAGFEIIYLSARIRILQSGLNDWLAKNGFPAGHLHMTQNRADRTDTAAFKARVLKRYVDDGWAFTAAFGDSSSDFQAYVQSGVPLDRIFALRRKGHTGCQPGVWQGCYGGWDELRAQIASILAH